MALSSKIGLDFAKRVFQAHGADAAGRVVFRKRLVRAKVLEFFAGQAPWPCWSRAARTRLRPWRRRSAAATEA